MAIAVHALGKCLLMKPYPIQLGISGPIALWARPDTMPNPVSYVAPTLRAVKSIFEAILRWKSVNVRPTGSPPENKAGEDCPRRLCLRNAFEQVYPHGG